MDPVKFRKRRCEGCEHGRAVCICDECRIFFCKTCSNNHKMGEETKNHSFINLNVPRELSTILPPEELARLFSSVELSSDCTDDDQIRDSAVCGSDFLEEDTSHTDTYIDEPDLSSSDFIEDSDMADSSRNLCATVSSSSQRDSSFLSNDFKESTELPHHSLMSDSEILESSSARATRSEYQAVSRTLPSTSTQDSAQSSEVADALSDNDELSDNSKLPWLVSSTSGQVVRAKSLTVKDTKGKTSLTRQASAPISVDVRSVRELGAARTLPAKVPGETGNDHFTPRLQVTDTQELTVKISKEKKGNDIRSALVLPSGLLVLADNGRKELKLYDQDGKCIFSVDDPPSTLSMTYVTNDIVATCGSYNKILLWSVRNMRITRQRKELEFSDSFLGIHFDDTLFCLLQNQGKYILIADIEGNIHHNITIQSKGKKSFKVGNSVRLDNSSKLVYYTIIDKPKAVRCINIPGVTIWESLIPGIPLGFTLAPQCLLVTDGSNNCVHVLSKSGSYVHKLVDRDMISGVPEGIHCDMKSGKSVINCSLSKDKRYRLFVFYLKY